VRKQHRRRKLLPAPPRAPVIAPVALNAAAIRVNQIHLASIRPSGKPASNRIAHPQHIVGIGYPHIAQRNHRRACPHRLAKARHRIFAGGFQLNPARYAAYTSRPPGNRKGRIHRPHPRSACALNHLTVSVPYLHLSAGVCFPAKSTVFRRNQHSRPRLPQPLPALSALPA